MAALIDLSKDDILSRPIQSFHSLAETSTDIESVLNSFQQLVSPYTSSIPLVDQVAMSESHNSLVRIRGMVQNISDPILYSSAVSIASTASGEKRTIPILFPEQYTPPDGWNLIESLDANITHNANSSLLINCVPTPNETEWCRYEWMHKLNNQSKLIIQSQIPIQVMVYKNLSEILLNQVCLFYGVITHTDTTLILHCLFHKRITMDTPLPLYKFDNTKPFILSVRDKLKSQLEFCVSGDKLAAEYLLFNLISRNYARCDVTQLGKFTLNLIRASAAIAQLISYLYPLLLQRYLYIPLSLSYLNDKKFVPKKDYATEQLETGCLQLVESTFLLLDETRLDNGKLGSTGVESLAALSELITTQCVQYDFTYHTLPFNIDTPILIITEGNKSLLPTDSTLPLVPDDDTLIRTEMSADELEMLRLYITVVRTMDYRLEDELQEIIQKDWVEMRKRDKKLSAEDLSQLLTVSRYLSISRGDCSLSEENWYEAKQLETERRSRVSSIK